VNGQGERLGIVLTGVVGSGKTSVAVALGELLEERGEAYAVVDLDWLAWFRPPAGSAVTVTDLLRANLHAVWRNFAAAGVDRLVVARHLRTREELRLVRDALDGVEIVSVRLDVPRDLLEARLRGRDGGAELAEHLAMLDEAASAEPFEDAAVDGTADSPREVALAVLRAAGWT
jgi:adenylylsulfate kinase